MKRCCKRLLWLPLIPAVLLLADDPAWKTKRPAQWSEEDAQEVLTKSPWARTFSAGLAGRQTEDQLRDGGDMGQPTGLGFDHVDPAGSGYHLSPKNIFFGKGGDDRSPRSLPGTFPLGLRWETALPVRMAEGKAHQDELALDGGGYQIAVFGVPTPDKIGDPRKLGEPLKKDAALRREGKKDARPSRVEAFLREEGIVIIYVFPPSAEITLKDRGVQFEAHIGRIAISQFFDLAQMQFDGKLEL
jgi:hypothetical protein